MTNILLSDALSTGMSIGLPLIIGVLIIIGAILGARKICASLISTLIGVVAAILICNVVWKAIASATTWDETLATWYSKLFSKIWNGETLNQFTLGDLFAAEAPSGIGSATSIKFLKTFLSSYQSVAGYENYLVGSVLYNTVAYYTGSIISFIVLFIAVKLVIVAILHIFKAVRTATGKVMSAILGGVFGLLEGVIVVMVILFALNAFTPTLAQKIADGDSSGYLYKIMQLNPLNSLYVKFTDREFILENCQTREADTPSPAMLAPDKNFVFGETETQNAIGFIENSDGVIYKVI